MRTSSFGRDQQLRVAAPIGAICKQKELLWSSPSDATWYRTRAAQRGPGDQLPSSAKVERQPAQGNLSVCITGRWGKVRAGLTDWCNCSFPSPGAKISESNFTPDYSAGGTLLSSHVPGDSSSSCLEGGQVSGMESGPALCSLQGKIMP